MAHGKNEPKIGQLITGDQKRDAIHVAVAPVTAAERLRPGEHVGLAAEDSTTVSKKPAFKVGIVDPFLSRPVDEGEKCWLFLYPNTVTSLRHEWAHPAFPEEVSEERVEEVLGEISRLGNRESIDFLTKFAGKVDMTYDELIQSAKNYLETGKGVCLEFSTPDDAFSNQEEFWRHFETMTGIKVPEETKSELYFRCSC